MLEPEIHDKLVELGRRLIDQKKARVLVEPFERAEGFWFGGGDIIRDDDGSFVIVGRYRNCGDSRTGLGAGERGWQCALLRAPAFDKPFEKFKSFSKDDLQVDGRKVVSIEGTAFRKTELGVELFVSTEKAIPYPQEMREFQKPGTGVWDIDVIAAGSVDALDSGESRTVLASTSPAWLHVKDPVIVDDATGDTELMFCAHPFAWSSSVTGLAVRPTEEQQFSVISEDILPRGAVWDVAATRVTDRLRVPQVGVLKNLPPLSLFFYDGAECLRKHEQNSRAVERPRGWSCEEVGGLAWCFDKDFPRLQRLSVNFPLFFSPHGSGCSRYVSSLVTPDAICAAWQQSQQDLSQPLVGHSLTMKQVERILA